MLAILPSPANEFRDPFSGKQSEEENPPSASILSPLSSKEHPHLCAPTTVSENNKRPPLQPHSSAASIHSNETDESRRKSSNIPSSPAPRDSDITSELDLQSVMRAMLAIQEGQQLQHINLKLVHIIMQTAGADYGVVMLREKLEKKALHVEVIGTGNTIKIVDHKPLNSQTDIVPTRLCEYDCLYA